jgi:hypothetical protein
VFWNNIYGVSGCILLVVISQSKLICAASLCGVFEERLDVRLPYVETPADSAWNRQLHIMLVLSELSLEHIPQVALQTYNSLSLGAGIVFFVSMGISIIALI